MRTSVWHKESYMQTLFWHSILLVLLLLETIAEVDKNDLTSYLTITYIYYMLAIVEPCDTHICCVSEDNPLAIIVADGLGCHGDCDKGPVDF